ncbi:hypothetical protein MMC30_002393 [Trapelia coarctata]|nr:hypothetical protein [Trapelia coarctata]
MATPYGDYSYLEHDHVDASIPLKSPVKKLPSSEYQQIHEPVLQHYVQVDNRLKRNIRIFKFLARILTFLLAIYTTYSQATTLNKFLNTRNIIINNRNAWAKQTVIWPTIVLLSTSALTLIISLAILIAYFFDTRHANKTHNTIGTAGTVAEMASHVAVWVGSAIAYKTGNTGSDLWGWTCSDGADGIQEAFRAVINFDDFCKVQTYAWFVSIAQAALAILTITVYLLAYRRIKHKEKMERHSSRVYSGNF